MGGKIPIPMAICRPTKKSEQANTITITISRWSELMKKESWHDALFQSGVEDWDGFEDAKFIIETND